MQKLIILFTFLMSTWTLIDLDAQKSIPAIVSVDQGIEHHKQHTFYLDANGLKRTLSKAVNARSNDVSNWTSIQLPDADGLQMDLKIGEDPVSLPEIYQMYPQNKTFKLQGKNDAHITGALTYSDQGFAGIIFTEDETIFIEPVGNGMHTSFVKNFHEMHKFHCGIDEAVDHSRIPSNTQGTFRGNDNKIRTYRLAVAAAGEFSDARSDNLTTINADLNYYVSVLNAYYEKELGIRFTRVSGNNLIFLDPATDNITPGNTSTCHTAIDAVMGSGNYDIGHAFGQIASGGSGIAGLGVVCNGSWKGRGWSSASNNNSMVDIMLHEVGHQFGAYHNFYGTAGNCVNRSVGRGYEPGSGNSLMSYESICFATSSPACATQNITPYVGTYYFHVNSLIEITNYVMQPGHCVAGVAGSNDIPVITMPANRTIPRGTPFALTGSATDSNPLTYNWEEYDTDNLTLTCPAGHPNDAANSTTAPLFRSFDPSATGSTRNFPKLSDILANTQTMGEILPNVARTINMRLTARDDLGGTNWGSMALTVNASAGPFVVNTANTATTYTAGQAVTVTWAVANTTAAPISCSNVNIKWSNDGGLSFPVTLVANTANDGTQSVNMPALGTTLGRIKVEAVGNYFFDINNANITVTSTCNPLVTSLTTTSQVTADAGAPALNLTMAYGQEVTSFTGTINTSDPSSSNPMRGSGNSSTCTALFSSRYETIPFTVSQTGNYSFGAGVSPFYFTSLFSSAFNSGSICTNWINANSYFFNSGSYGYSDGSVSATLTQGQAYVMRVAQNGTYNISISGAGSVLVSGGSLPSGFAYKYVIVKDGTTPTVKAIETTANMTNTTTYTSGTYKVYGFMVGSAVSLSAYIDQPLTNLTTAIGNGTVCGLMTNNFRPVTITGCVPTTKFVTSTSSSPSINGSLSNILAGACLGDTIKFSLPANSTITFTSQMTIASDLVIDGTGMTNLTLSGNNAVRLFEVNAGVTFGVKNIKLINGSSSTNGGAIWNKGTLILNGATLDGNKQGAANKALTNDGSISILGNTMIMM
ncbi:MAG TPA: zinc-dependent metalloprotease family protein [Saprospiraceae bacterium]|nr:zinc-dependent metalloprotease family protein [Saprospiraceae bacterium]